MIILALIILGLSFGSFVNALTWRIYKQHTSKKMKTRIKNRSVNLSMLNGRSVCVHCGHELAAIDLIPLLSWLSLQGRCRYCKKPIEDSPLVEIAMSGLFVASYLYWPTEVVSGLEWAVFGAWISIVIGLLALIVYDFRHMILPNRIVFPLIAMAGVFRLLVLLESDASVTSELIDVFYGVLAGSGLFYLLFQVSGGRWIGGGDVKLGILIGVLLGPKDALVALLAAFYIAAFTILPLMLIGKLDRKAKIPFGPFLIVGLILAMLWGVDIRGAYSDLVGL